MPVERKGPGHTQPAHELKARTVDQAQTTTVRDEQGLHGDFMVLRRRPVHMQHWQYGIMEGADRLQLVRHW